MFVDSRSVDEDHSLNATIYQDLKSLMAEIMKIKSSSSKKEMVLYSIK